MLFKNRKLYPHGQNKNIFLMQIPKVVCDDLELQRDTKLCVEYNDQTIKVTVQKDE